MITTRSATTTDTSDLPIYTDADFLSPLECQRLISVHGRELFASYTTGKTSLRVSDQRYFDDDQLMNKLAPVVREYAIVRGIDIGDGTDFECPAIVRYKADGKYDWHMDNELTRPEDRKIAVVLALNSDFEGGGTEWMWPHPLACCHIPPKTGALALFPSILLHRGMPVTSGERWIVVTWALGPPWR